MKIGIIGGGVVGRATAHVFKDSHEVRIYDIAKERSTHCLDSTLQCDIVFVCLPTPQKTGSLECDTYIVDSFFCDMEKQARAVNFVLRSTVPIGYTKKLRKKYDMSNIVHSPEFLTARTSLSDAMCPARNIIGSPVITDTGIHLNSTCDKLFCLYKQRWPHVPIYCMTSGESEAVKLFQNGFSAVKITLMNEFRCLANAKNLDWDAVMRALLAGGWINPMHTQVPGPDGKRGFGGACLEKDLANLIECSGLTMPVCKAAYDRNKDIDREDNL